MTLAYSTKRLPLSHDVVNRKLSFWTDNGAVYFQSYWDDVCNRNCTLGNDANTLFDRLKAFHVEQRLPFAIYQLDTWWFYQGEDARRGNGIDCIDWRPRQDLWPLGLPSVTQKDVPLLLYAWGWVPVEKGQRMLNFSWVNNGDGTEAIVALNETYAFYSMIRDRFLTFNGTSFEQDNMGSIGGWQQIYSNPVGGEIWWSGFASPWCEANIPVQICEATASDLLESLKYPCITSTRDQIDDVPGEHQSHGPNEDLFLIRWHVGFDRMLIGALHLRPFYDNVWSTPNMPGPPWFGQNENYTELAMALSVLGGGAVGIGDMIGYSNRTLIMACAMEDGTLLSPSRPSCYIDEMYLPGSAAPFPIAIGRVLQAPTFIGVFTWMTVVAVDVGSSFKLLPSYLSPDISKQSPGVTSHLAIRWSPGFAAVDVACADGAPVRTCAATFDVDTPIELFTGVPAVNYTHFHEIVSIAPVFASGFSLLGELGKFVRVSNSRFPAIAPSAAGMDFTAVGAPLEALSLAILAPSTGGPVIRRIVVNFPVGSGPGLQTATVVCAGASASPCSVSFEA